MVLGEDGVLRQAQLAAEKTKEADKKEQEDLDKLVGIIDEAVNGKDPETLKEALEKQKYFSYTTKYDKEGNKIDEDSETPTKTPAITIPAGFKVSEGEEIEEGIVISDRDGNEFVWVPCEKTEYVKHTYTGSNNNDAGTNVEDENESGWNTYSYRAYKDWTGDQSQENENKASVEKYGGFYIARYEAGVPSNAEFYVGASTIEEKSDYYTASANDKGSSEEAYIKNTTTTKSGIKLKPVSRAGNQCWNYINQTNAKTVSENMYAGSRSVVSRLVDGIAWDRTVEWIAEDTSLSDIVKKDSTTVGNYANNTNDSKITTSSPILWAEHLYTPKSRKWYPAKNYRYDNEFTSGYTASYTVQDGEGANYTGYEENDGNTYAYYVEMATGTSESTKLKNIYDLGGNMYEWTTERGSHKATDDNATTYDQKTHAVHRGGGFNSSGANFPVAIRYGDNRASSTYSSFGFRVALYLK